MMFKKQNLIIIFIGLVGCFLTSITGSMAIMLSKGWTSQGGFEELFHRLSISYPSSCLVVFFIFPIIVPKLSQFLENKLN
jgi:hypothetical protein